MIKTIWLKLATATLFLNLTACSTLSTQSVKPEQTNPPISKPSEKGWRYARFSIPRPKGTNPNWAMGTLIAGEVISPILKKHRNQVDLWRFHRRAGQDKYGHVFSFIFYSPNSTAASIYQDIKANPLLQRLQKTKQITLLTPDDLSKNPKSKIEDTSDKSWSDIIQRTWPGYIMGVSQMWLDVITEIDSDQDQSTKPEKRYQEVQKIVTEIWQREGKHAMLHHLNAIYAYQPIFMRF